MVRRGGRATSLSPPQPADGLLVSQADPAAKPPAPWIKAIEDRPTFLKDAMNETRNLPRHAFRFWNREGDLEFVVSRSGSIHVVVEPWDEDDEDDEEMEDCEDPEYLDYRKRRALALARVAALRGHGYRTIGDRLWGFTECIHSERSLFGDVTVVNRAYHDRGWRRIAEAVTKAYETRICPCARRLCDNGKTCYMCVLETAGVAAPAPVKPPELVGEMALALMSEGGDWKCESEGAAVCAVCYRRKTHQMMFVGCGHLACGECCAGIGSKNCPHCRGPVTALRKVLYSA